MYKLFNFKLCYLLKGHEFHSIQNDSHCGRYDSSFLKLAEQRQDKMPIALLKKC